MVRHFRANAVAYLALFVALGGTATAAAPLITGKQVRNGSLTGRDVRDRSLTGKDVRDRSLSAADLAPGTIPTPPAPAPAPAKAPDADRLDGRDATDFLAAGGKAADADTLDGRDAADFLAAGGKAADADLLDGQDAADFLAAGGKAADADLLDGNDASAFARAAAQPSVATGTTTLTSVSTCADGSGLVAGPTERQRIVLYTATATNRATGAATYSVRSLATGQEDTDTATTTDPITFSGQFVLNPGASGYIGIAARTPGGSPCAARHGTLTVRWTAISLG